MNQVHSTHPLCSFECFEMLISILMHVYNSIFMIFLEVVGFVFAVKTAIVTVRITGCSNWGTSLNHWSRGYNFFHAQLCWTEHEILNSHKYKNIMNVSFFLGSHKPRMIFSCSKRLKCKQLLAFHHL